jgi:hypothetical protein
MPRRKRPKMLHDKEAVDRIIAGTHRIIKDSLSEKIDDWRHDVGILKSTVRIDIPIVDPVKTVLMLRTIADILPVICAAIEKEGSLLEKQIVAQTQLQWLRGRVKRGRK